MVVAVEQFATGLLADYGMELVEVQFRRESHGWVLRLFIDRPGGVTIDDCATVSREISAYLDVEDLIEHAYHLEVSSPGLERPLKREADFVRFAGRKARIKLCEPVDGQKVFVGMLEGVNNGDVIMEVDGKRHRFAFSSISRARLTL